MITDYVKESGLLKALAHPVRLRIAEGLTRQECNIDKIVRALKIPQSTVSQHIAVLRSKGVIHARKDGVRTCCCVVDPKVKKLLNILGRDKGRP